MLRVFGLPEQIRQETARLLAGFGFDAVTVGAVETAERIRPAAEAGLAVWSCRAAFSIRHLTEDAAARLMAVDLDGAPQPWFGSGCPNAPELRRAHLEHIERVARSGGFAGFMLDGIRFASPNAADGFFTCFCQRCATRAAELGFDFEAVRRDVRSLRDWTRQQSREPLANGPALLSGPLAERWPGAVEWLRFREACIRAHVVEVRHLVDDVNRQTGGAFRLGAYLFAPGFSLLVGQDYGALAPLLDVVSPMLYRTLGPGDACLRSEWDALARLGLIAACGEFRPEDVGNEAEAAAEQIASAAQLVPILELTDARLAETVGATKLAGADGLDYFSFKPGREDLAAAAARVSLDTAR